MSVFGNIVKTCKYIDDELFIGFDEENYKKLELELKLQEYEIERLNNIIKEVKEYIKDNAMYSEEEKICCDDLYTSDCDEVLKILDKVEENK